MCALDELNPREISVLLRGEPEKIAAWTGQWSARRFALQVVVIVVGAGLYGAAMGWWRDPQQALYVTVKFPLIILLTTAGTALLNRSEEHTSELQSLRHLVC